MLPALRENEAGAGQGRVTAGAGAGAGAGGMDSGTGGHASTGNATTGQSQLGGGGAGAVLVFSRTGTGWQAHTNRVAISIADRIVADITGTITLRSVDEAHHIRLQITGVDIRLFGNMMIVDDVVAVLFPGLVDLGRHRVLGGHFLQVFI